MDGFIVPLSNLIATGGRSYEHSLICANVIGALGNALVGSPCCVASGLRVGRTGHPFYFHPDATVIRGQPELERRAKDEDTLLNPCTLVEVLSPFH